MSGSHPQDPFQQQGPEFNPGATQEGTEKDPRDLSPLSIGELAHLSEMEAHGDPDRVTLHGPITQSEYAAGPEDLEVPQPPRTHLSIGDEVVFLLYIFGLWFAANGTLSHRGPGKTWQVDYQITLPPKMELHPHYHSVYPEDGIYRGRVQIPSHRLQKQVRGGPIQLGAQVKLPSSSIPARVVDLQAGQVRVRMEPPEECRFWISPSQLIRLRQADANPLKTFTEEVSCLISSEPASNSWATSSIPSPQSDTRSGDRDPSSSLTSGESPPAAGDPVTNGSNTISKSSPRSTSGKNSFRKRSKPGDPGSGTKVTAPIMSPQGSGRSIPPMGSRESIESVASGGQQPHGSAASSTSRSVRGGSTERIQELQEEKQRLLKAGIVQGWIEFYTVKRTNKRAGKVTEGGKVIPESREYEYARLMTWDPQQGKARTHHLNPTQYQQSKAGIQRRQRVEQIDQELAQLGAPVLLPYTQCTDVRAESPAQEVYDAGKN